MSKFDENIITEIDTNGDVVLALIDELSVSNTFPNLGTIAGYYYFLIKLEDLRKHNFTKVVFVATGS